MLEWFVLWMKLLTLVISVDKPVQHQFSQVKQNGYFTSNKTKITRRCNQGNHLLLYIFIICSDTCSCGLSCHKSYRCIGGRAKLSQHACNILNDQVDMLIQLMHVSKLFKRLSRVGVNKDKTKVAKIAALRGRGIHWEDKYGFEWTNTWTFEI